ncbi:MAG: carbonic anhydrase [Pseudomonadota bacterium]
MTWLAEISTANTQFQKRIKKNDLPVERQPCPFAVITCMDPRINIEAIGISGFTPSGESDNQVRVIRTIGAMHENRSLLIGIHMAGFKEIAVLMHTDCGCCLAHSKIDLIETNMKTSLSPQQQKSAADIIRQSKPDNLSQWLKTFEDPYVAVAKEVSSIRQSPFTPGNIIVHGLVYDLATGAVEIVVDGY